MEPFTPSTEQVRAEYVTNRGIRVPTTVSPAEEFDRWLEQHDRALITRGFTNGDREAVARELDPDAWELTYAEFRLKYGTFSDADPKSQQRRRDRSMIDAFIALTR